jgi:hypothetical protein
LKSSIENWSLISSGKGGMGKGKGRIGKGKGNGKGKGVGKGMGIGKGNVELKGGGNSSSPLESSELVSLNHLFFFAILKNNIYLI